MTVKEFVFYLNKFSKFNDEIMELKKLFAVFIKSDFCFFFSVFGFA